MLADHLVKEIKKVFVHEPTPSQERLMVGFAEFLLERTDRPVLLVKGYAGTGKTSMVSAFVRFLESVETKFLLMAPTGRAAKVMALHSDKPAYTIHKKIYRQKSSSDGFGAFDLNKNFTRDTVFFVDEASMISGSVGEGTTFGTGNLLEDLLKFVFENENNRLVIIGDTAQLPPVGVPYSPALEEGQLEALGMDVRSFFLNDVVRQEQESGILMNATLLRETLDSGTTDGEYPRLNAKDFKDFERINGEELIEAISSSYYKSGMDETIVVNRSNKRATLYNNGIRNSVLFREERLTPGDMVMVVKNNYFWLKENKNADFIANGDIAEVVRIRRYEELYGYQFANVMLRFPDYEGLELEVKIMIDALQSDTGGLTYEEQRVFYAKVMEDYADLPTQKKRFDAVRENPYYNALQVKFAYAITCHKAQGGQWKTVFVDQGMINEEMLNRDYYRWLYTAITRATEKVYLVNFKDEFFIPEDVVESKKKKRGR